MSERRSVDVSEVTGTPSRILGDLLSRDEVVNLYRNAYENGQVSNLGVNPNAYMRDIPAFRVKQFSSLPKHTKTPADITPEAAIQHVLMDRVASRGSEGMYIPRYPELSRTDVSNDPLRGVPIMTKSNSDELALPHEYIHANQDMYRKKVRGLPIRPGRANINLREVLDKTKPIQKFKEAGYSIGDDLDEMEAYFAMAEMDSPNRSYARDTIRAVAPSGLVGTPKDPYYTYLAHTAAGPYMIPDTREPSLVDKAMGALEEGAKYPKAVHNTIKGLVSPYFKAAARGLAR